MNEKSETSTLNTICRTCLSKSDDLHFIFDQKIDSTISVKDMIMEITTITISENDELTQYVCPKCLCDVISAYSFKLKCEKSDKALKLQAKSLKIECNNDLSKQLDKLQEITKLSENQPFLLCDNDKLSEFDSDDNLPILKYILRVKENEKPNDFTSDNSFSNITLKQSRKRLKTVKKKKQLKFPVLEKHIKKIYNCVMCHALFKSENILKKHYAKLHKNYSAHVMNNMIDKSLSNSDSIDSQERLGQIYDSKTSLFKCQFCEYKCKSLTDFKKHNKSHSDYKPISCDECNFRCSSVESLAKHKRIHSGEKPFACEICPYRSTTSSALKTHSFVHKENRPYNCKLCEFTCKYAASLTHHIARKHLNKRNHGCEICGKRFFSTSHRNIHMRVHTGEKPYSCDKCGLPFSQKSNLDKHINIFHNENPQTFLCSFCNFVTKSKSLLQNHQKKHSEEKPLKCDICEYSCISTSSLNLHKKRHVGDAKYSCDICNYKCYSNFRLKAHKRKHTGERPYICDQCDYRAKTDSGLRNHKISHANEQRYSCSSCSFRTNYRSNLTKHELKLCGKISRNDNIVN